LRHRIAAPEISTGIIAFTLAPHQGCDCIATTHSPVDAQMIASPANAYD